MQVTGKLIDGIVIIAPDSNVEIDVGNADAFKAQALQLIAGNPKVVLDISGVYFFDSAGLGVLLSINKKARENQGDLFLSGLRPAIREIFQVIGFDTVFAIFPDVPAAVNKFNEG